MVALCFAATAINYIDRANLSLAMPLLQREFGFGSATAGLILSGFFWSYALMQLPAGWAVDRFGARRVYAFSAAWWSLFTMVTALARGAGSLLGCRILLGAGEAGAYPCNAKVTALWFPRSERAFASALFDSGSRVGATLSWPVVGFLLSFFGWRIAFLVTGLLGAAWIAVWLKRYRDPSPSERVEEAPPAPREAPDRAPISWADLFRYRTIWGMCLGFFCLNFVIYFFITWFPSYLVQARGFSMLKVGSLGAVPALFAVVGGWCGGFCSDALSRRGCSLTVARKTCLVGGLLLSSSIALAAVVPSQAQAMLLFCLSYASLAFAAASVWSLPADVAPTPAHVASIAGIQNFFSGVAGILTTTFTGLMVAVTHGSFVLPLVIGGGVCIAGALSYLLLVGRIEPLGRAGEHGATPA
jgi:MFS family permease